MRRIVPYIILLLLLNAGIAAADTINLGYFGLFLHVFTLMTLWRPFSRLLSSSCR